MVLLHSLIYGRYIRYSRSRRRRLQEEEKRFYVPAPQLYPPQTGMVDYCERDILYLCNVCVCAKENFYGW